MISDQVGYKDDMTFFPDASLGGMGWQGMEKEGNLNETRAITTHHLYARTFLDAAYDSDVSPLTFPTDLADPSTDEPARPTSP